MLDWNLVPLLLDVVAFVVAWARIEKRHAETSRGIASMIVGCALFCVGVVNGTAQDKLLIWSLLVVGSFVALFGTARFVAWQIKNTT